MSLECSECERDLRGEHGLGCSRLRARRGPRRPKNSNLEVHLAFPDEDNGIAWEPRILHQRLNGLVLTNSADGWVISHERSGLALATWPQHQTKAVEALEALAALADWTEPAPRLPIGMLRELGGGIIELTGGIRKQPKAPQ